MSKSLCVVDSYGRELPLWTVDFETYYDTKDKYSLRKMSTAQYVRDPRFKAHGLSYVDPEGNSGWITHKEIPSFFASIDWNNTAMLAHNCVTGDHEVLTPEGWVPFTALTGTEHIAQWNPKTEVATFTPYKLICKEYTGPMYKWDSTQHKGIYTPEHRLYYATPSVSSYREATVAKITTFGPNNVYLPKAALKLQDHETFSITEDEARFLEAVRADGSWQKGRDRKKIFGIHFIFQKKRKVKRLELLLKKLNYSYNKQQTIRSNNLCVHINISLKQNPDAKKIVTLLGTDKVYNKSILTIPPAAQKAILNELQYWDGSQGRTETEGKRTFSAKEENLYWLQILAALNGMSLNYSKWTNNRGYSSSDGVIYCGTLRNKKRFKLQYKPEIVDFSGSVYCVTVPDKAFLIRRAGVVWLNGNCAFDAFIASEVYNIVPSYLTCSMSMSRGEFGPGVRASLAELSKRLNQEQEKITGELEKTDGIRDLSLEQEEALIPYAIRDSELARKNFEVMYFDRGYPEKEMHIIDLTIRAFVDPKLMIDASLCLEEIENEDRRMESLLNSDLVGQAQLSDPCKAILSSDKGLTGLMRSRPCFAELLRSRGVEPPLKERKNAQGIVIEGEYTYAFAKNDIELITLGEDPRVSDLVATWCGLKSTIRKNKAQRFLDVTCNGTKPFAVPLLYCGGRTHRWSGAGTDENDRASAGGYNVQNMSSGRDGGGKRLREAIRAPKGYSIVAIDSSSIELRCSAWLAQEQDLLDTLRVGGDPYSALATEIFGVPVTKNNENSHLRAIGKAGELSLQFGVGWKKFFSTVQTNYGLDTSVFSELDAQKVVEFYRKKRKGIIKIWNDFREFLVLMAAKEAGFDYKVFRFENDRIYMPNQLAIWYRDLHWHNNKESNQSGFVYRFKDEWVRIYGQKCYENIVQSVARTIVAEQAIQISKKYPIVLLVHDEIVYLAPKEEAEEALEFGLSAMRVAPSWALDMPLDAEGKTGEFYAK